METRTLTRLAGIAAIAGGLLRAADPLYSAAHLADPLLQQIWFVTDVLLLLGVTGIYLNASAKVGGVGLAGALVFAIGILLVRSASVSFFGIGGYQAAATIALVGIAILALTLLRQRSQATAAILWLLALGLGLGSRARVDPIAFVAFSGVIFGLGFAVAGGALLAGRAFSRQSEAAP